MNYRRLILIPAVLLLGACGSHKTSSSPSAQATPHSSTVAAKAKAVVPAGPIACSSLLGKPSKVALDILCVQDGVDRTPISLQCLDGTSMVITGAPNPGYFGLTTGVLQAGDTTTTSTDAQYWAMQAKCLYGK